MNKKLLSLVVCSIIVTLFIMAFIGNDSEPPVVLNTTPHNGAINVDTSLKEISVTFNELMMDGSWSWSYEDKNKFPEITGKPYYTENYTKCILPVRLKPNQEYIIWINTKDFKNFKDKAGNSAVPYKFSFKTK